MNNIERLKIIGDIQINGMSEVFVEKNRHKDVKDKKFQELRAQYIKSWTELQEYIYYSE